MILKEITLLTLEEYLENTLFVSSINKFWWLKTPRPHINGAVYAINDENTVDFVSAFNVAIGVRPVCVFDISPSNPLFWCKPGKVMGSKIKYGKYTWTVFDISNNELRTLCDVAIVDHCFDSYDSNSNKWEVSELKRWLETEGIKLIDGLE